VKFPARAASQTVDVAYGGKGIANESDGKNWLPGGPHVQRAALTARSTADGLKTVNRLGLAWSSLFDLPVRGTW